MAEPVRAGVIGVGALGQHHARVYESLPEARLVGVYDRHRGRAAEVAARHSRRALADLRELLAEAEAAPGAVPTGDHHRVARAGRDEGRHAPGEQPTAPTPAEGDDHLPPARR